MNLNVNLCAKTTNKHWFLPFKYLLIMKLIVLLTIIACFQVSAATVAQNITLSEKNKSLNDLFTSIKQQSGYHFFWKGDDFANVKVTVQLKNATIGQAMNEVLKGLSLTYTITEQTIVIQQKRELSLPDKSIAAPVPPPITINGKVTDEKNESLPGANIVIKGTSKGTTTDVKGKFSLKVKEGDVLLISFLGYITKEIKISAEILKNGSIGNISLVMAQTQLSEVVVKYVNTGYQHIRPEQSTGATSQIGTKEYESQISTDFISGLANKLPGLMINNDIKFTSTINGVKTSNSLFNIRGISTITGNQNPLIVVDGYPTELSLNMIDPNEIKSVTILKDAAAATIYGVRASNGVIVIERKQAVTGQPKVSFRATASLTPKEDYSRYRWAPDASAINVNYDRDIYSTSVNDQTWNNLFTNSGSRAYSPAYYTMAQQAAAIVTPYQANAAFKNIESYNNAKEYSRLFLRTAAAQTYNLDISGGNPNALYYFTANYTDNQLTQINNSNNHFLLSGRSTLNFSKRFSLKLTTDYQEEHISTVPVPDINSIYPYEHLQDANGNPLPIYAKSGINPYYNNVLLNTGLEDNLYYPLVDINEINDKTHSVNNRITADFDYKIGYGFDLAFGGIYETSLTDTRHYASENSSEARQYINAYVTQATGGSVVFNIAKGGFLQDQTASSRSYTLRAQLNYNKQIGSDHSINGILGAEMRDVTNQSSSAAYFGYNDQTLLQQPVNYYDIANSNIIGDFTHTRTFNYANLFNQQYTDDRYISGYANIVYAFRNTYSVTGSMRIDQSNLFGTDPKYRYKPLWSIGTAWNISKEDFMQHISWVKQLKLRLAYGFNGNVAKLSLPQVIAQSYVNSYTNPFSDALREYSYANSGLRWEQTKNFNVGLDYGIFQNITGSIDYYNKRSTDLLASAYIDPTIGTSPSLINSASINNKGLEISLHADWISTSKINWNTGLILSHNTSKVLKVYQNLISYPGDLNATGYLKGYPVGALFAYRWAGLDSTGIPFVKDQKGNVYSSNDGNHMTGLDASGTIRYMGSSIPTITAGLSNRIDIGNFYFYCMVNYYGGFKVVVPRPDPSAVRPLAGAGNYWKQLGDEKTTDIMSLTGFTNYYPNLAYNYADAYVVNGDYLTLKDITASYSFNDSKFFKRVGITHFEVKLQASNIWTVGLNKYNYSAATSSYAKSYLTPTYTIGIFTNF